MKLPVGYVPGQGVVKATAYGGYGQRMLERMGWSKGQGLGKEKDGITQAIEVKKKEDTAGVGADGQPGWDWNWKYWEDAYNSTVQKINHDDSSSSSSDSDSDEEAHHHGKVIHNRDGTVATASNAELKLAAQLAKDPWGRWGGRGGKMARIREQEAADAAKLRESLGLPAPAARSAGTASTSSSSSSDSDSNSEDDTQAKKKGKKKDKKDKKGKEDKKKGKDGKGSGKGKEVEAEPAQPSQKEPPKKRIVVVLKLKDQPLKKVEFKPTPATGWWGANYFISVGAMETLEEEAEHQKELAQQEQKRPEEAGAEGGAQRQGFDSKRRGFDEDDQTALYMQAHEHQRVGRRGLGKSTTVKIAGGKWEGTKMTFEDDGDGKAVSNAAAAAAAAAGQDEGAAEEQGAEEGVKSKEGKKAKKAKRKAEDAQEEEVRKEKKSKRKTAGEDEAEEGKKKKKKRKGGQDGDQQVAEEAEKLEKAEVGQEGGKKSKKDKKDRKKKGQEQDDQGSADGENGHANGSTLSKSDSKRWLKVARKLLKKAPEQKLKAKQLLQQLQEHVASMADGGSAPSLASLSHLCSAGSQLEMQGKYVVLV